MLTLTWCKCHHTASQSHPHTHLYVWKPVCETQPFELLQDLEWFWQMVTDMDDTKRRQLLSFWTSMSTVPAGESPLQNTSFILKG